MAPGHLDEESPDIFATHDHFRGGFRVCAVQVHGNLWAPDPACYLRDEEIKAAA